MSDGSHVRTPRQERSRRTLERLIEATRELLHERAFDEISVDEIVERAGSSKGSFYQRFPDKDSLLRHLIEVESAEARERWKGFLEPRRWQQTSLRAFTEAFVERVLAIYRERRHLMRAFTHRLYSHDDREIKNDAIDLNRLIAERFRDVVLSKADEVEHPDPEIACTVIVVTLAAMLPPLFLFPVPEPESEPIRDDVLEEEIRRMIVRYLSDPRA